jgi:uncharacterized protein YydD (DUF2326 family)
VNGSNPNNKRRENSRHLTSKRKEYLKCKIKHIEADSKSEKNVDLRGRMKSFKKVTNL